MKVNEKVLKRWMYILLFAPFLIRLLTDNFGVSYDINILIDVWMIILLVFTLLVKRRAFWKNVPKLIHIAVYLSVIALIISFILGEFHISNFLYGIRPFSRLMVSFFVSCLIFDEEDYFKIYKWVKLLLIINLPIMLIQFFFFGLKQDVLGGTFGNTQGCNSIQNLLCCFILVLSLNLFLNKEIKQREFLLILFSTIVIAALAEITAFFFELVIIFLISFLFFNPEKLTFRKIAITALIVLALIFGIRIYLKIFPERAFLLNFSDLLTYLGFDYNTGNTGVYRVSRLRVFQQINASFLDLPYEKLFGYGLGNCSNGSAFYKSYESIYHFTYLSSSITYLETGVLGVIITFLPALTALIHKDDKYRVSHVLSFSRRTFAILTVILFFYNTTTRDYYTSFFLGSMLAINMKKSKKGNG